MFWIKFILIAAILLVVLVLGVEFSTLNTDPVKVNYLIGITTLELAWVIVGAFAAGVVITGLVGIFVVLPLRWQTARLRQAVASKDQEISLLVRKVGREAH
ncbi:MAG: LapA family protein [Candidatus Contendobacter sp.]|jgi:putative membrane protein|nr:LapA family protein [Gammaproteobacteria bacterium]MCC8992670.1 LapA family protein [Candidatus Contendobacter sp.]